MKFGFRDDSPERIEWEERTLAEIAGYIEELGVEPDIMFGWGVMLAARAVERTACEKHKLETIPDSLHFQARVHFIKLLLETFAEAPRIEPIRSKLTRQP